MTHTGEGQRGATTVIENEAMRQTTGRKQGRPLADVVRGFCVANLWVGPWLGPFVGSHLRLTSSRLTPVKERRHTRQLSGHAAEWHARSRGGVTKRCAYSQFTADVAGCPVGGGADSLRDPGDHVACRVSPPPARVSCCVRFCSVDVARLGFWAAGQRQETRASFQQESTRRRDRRGWHVEKGRRNPFGAEADQPSRSEVGGRGPPRCVCGFRFPAHGQTDAWSQKRARTWPHEGAHRDQSKEGDAEAVMEGIQMRSASKPKSPLAGPNGLRGRSGPPLWGLLHKTVQNARVAQIGHVALIARCAAWVACSVVVDGPRKCPQRPPYLGAVKRSGSPKGCCKGLPYCCWSPGKAAGQWSTACQILNS